MNREDAIQAAWDWIVRTHGAQSEGLRILTDNVVLVRGQWHVPYDAVDDVLVPLPAVEVPDDGGEPHAYVAQPPSPWQPGKLDGQPGPDDSVIDFEWDLETFAHLGIPTAAVLGWQRGDEHRRNSEHTPGPGGRGWPLPETPADKIYAYYQCGWLDEDASFLAGLLDVVVCTTDEIGQDPDGTTWHACYTSQRLLPPGTRQWREAGVRELLVTTTADALRVNPGHALQTPLAKGVADALDRWPEPFELPAAVTREETGSPALLARVDEARANGFAFTAEERAVLEESLQRDEGTPPTFGKASGHPATKQHAWSWVAGVYAGFALGESQERFAADGSLTAGLFKLTDNFVREVAEHDPRLSADHPALPRALDWLPPAPNPGREVLALVAAVGAGHPAVRGTGWDDEISPVFERALSRTAFSRAPHYIQYELGLPTPDPDTAWGQAVEIVSSLGHRPQAALYAAPTALTAALVGALLGAWHGIPGLPEGGANYDRDLAETVATDAFLAFDPAYEPKRLSHPGLPEVTDAMRAEAAKTPGGWLYCADPDVDPRYVEGVPLVTMLGGYEVGADGQLTGNSWINDEYLPSPRRLGLPQPENPFEDVLNLVTAGWLPYEAILSAALHTEFLVHAPDGTPAVTRDANGTSVLAVYSSARYFPEDAGEPGRLLLSELLPVLPQLMVLVNPGSPVVADIRGEHLAQLAALPSA